MGRRARQFRMRMTIASLSMSAVASLLRLRRNSVEADFDGMPTPVAAEGNGETVQHADESQPAFPPRAERLEALAATHYDVLVVGGGAVGLYTALDARTRGLKVALVEAHDYGAGRSGCTPKVLQAGVHDFQRVVRRRDLFLLGPALDRQQEYATLLRVAPRLMEPVDCVLPVFRLLESVELVLCAFVAAVASGTTRGPTGVRPPLVWSADQVVDAYPGIQQRKDEGGVHGAVITDGAVINDARMAVEVASKASRAGATVLNHCRVTACETKRVPRPTSYALTQQEVELYSLKAAIDHWRQGDKMSPNLVEEAKGVAARKRSKEFQELEGNVDRFVAATVRDELTGKEMRVEADVLINCAGRWSDEVRLMVSRDFSDKMFAHFSSALSYVVPRVSPDVVHAAMGDEADSTRGAPRRRVLSVAGSHLNSQRFYVTPHPAIEGASIVGAVDALHSDEPGDRRERGVEPPLGAHVSDRRFLQEGLDTYGITTDAAASVLAPTTSLFVAPTKQPQLIPNAMRYETAIDTKHTDAHMVTPYGATWADARLVAERAVATAWKSVLHRQGDLASEKPKPLPPSETHRIGIAADVPGAKPGSRERRLGAVGAEAVAELERKDKSLAEPLVPSARFFTRAEALYGLQHEGAETALDVLRRAGAVDAAAAGCLAELPKAVAFLGDALGWDKARRRFELETGKAFIQPYVPPTAA